MSESESDIERVSSGTLVSFDLAPVSKDYNMKLWGSGAKSASKLIFEVKKDKPLPYTKLHTTKKGKGNFGNMEKII